MTCFNCGSTSHKLVLVYSAGGTFQRCQDQAGCRRRLGPCAICGRPVDQHEWEWNADGSPAGRIQHDFQRNETSQRAVDAAYSQHALDGAVKP